MNYIRNYEGLYSINKDGKIYSHYTNKFLKPLKLSNGYLVVNLYKNRESKTQTIHRLVAETLIPNPNNYPCINHIDFNKSNNSIFNLEWCTHSQNFLHDFRNGNRIVWNKGIKWAYMSELRKGSKNPMARKVKNIETGEIFNTLTEASQKMGISIGTLAARLYRNSKCNNLKYYDAPY